MIVVRITSQLANQMFAYAAIKTIAEDNGYDFRYIHEYCSAAESSYGSIDKKYGRDFDTVFSIPKQEELERLDTSKFIAHEECDYIKKYDSFYYEDAIHIQDNTYMKGHFISPKYFSHRLPEVKEWFQFPEDIDSRSEKIIHQIRTNNPGKKVVTVHFRVGQDYLLHGYLMNSDYWISAAKKMIDKYGNVKFVVFCDKQTKVVTSFMKEYDCELIRGSLAEDMCCMTKCDAHIISNSTFSMIGALLNIEENPYVIRPSHYFTGPRSEQKNCFLDEWDIVESRRDMKGYVLASLKIGSIRNKIYGLIHN